MRKTLLALAASVSLLFGGLAVASTAEAAPVAPSVSAPGIPPVGNLSSDKPKGVQAPKGNPDRAHTSLVACGSPCYSYAAKKDHFLATPADGVSISTQIFKPTLLASDSHTLWEVTAESDDGQQVIEVGATNDTLVCGSLANSPCLFTFAWVNGVPKCYNGCGFTPAVGCAPYCMGSPITSLVGQTKAFNIQYISGAWWVAFDGAWRGAWPGTLWSAAPTPVTFTQTTFVQAFDEIAANNDPTETDMGSGVLADSTTTGALTSSYQTVLAGVATFGAWDSTTTTAPDRWAVTDVTAASFRSGGPGGHENLPTTSPTCSGVGVAPSWGGYGAMCAYSNTSGGVPITKVADWDPGAKNVCVPNLGTADGIYPTPIRVFENTMYVKFAWFRDANCAGAHIDIDYDKTVLPAGWTALTHASRMRWATPNSH